MRIRIRDDTVYSYSAPVKEAIAVLRLTPRSHEGQHVASWRLDLDVDCLLRTSEDAFGNIVHMFNVDGLLQQFGVLIEGEVETFDAAGIVRGAVERFPPGLYLRETALTASDAALRDFATRIAAGRQGPLDILHNLMGAIHTTMKFDRDLAPAGSAPEALHAGCGPAQDVAQVFVTCARHLDIPARYISGFYLPAGGHSGEPPEHAWAEAFVPEIGWIGFDATVNVCPQEAHVRIACGLDYLGAAPVRAARAGGSSETLAAMARLGQKQASQSRAQRQE